jgi:hypothetical protein
VRSKARPSSARPVPLAPFSIEELETGLRLLGRGDVDLSAFWDQNIVAFRQTVLVAIRDTSDALLSPNITRRWRLELESQLEALVRYLKLADDYMALRFPCPETPRTH